MAHDAAGEAGEDRRECGQPSGVCHIPTGGGCGAEGAVAKNPRSRRWAAAGPLAAMTAVHPGASRCARQDRCVPRRSKGALTGRPQRVPHCAKWSRGRDTHRQVSPIESGPAYRDSLGPNSRSDAHCATILGDSEKPSGENPDSNKEKQLWVIRGKKTKAGGKNRKRPSLIQRKNEN